MATITDQERLLKAEHDAMNARAAAERAKAINDYNIMMGVLEDPAGEEEDDE